MILLLSQQSVTKGWVQQEYNAAINHQTQHRDFRIIPVRLDDVELPGFLQNYSATPLARPDLTLDVARAILQGLYQPVTRTDPRASRRTFLSRGWHTTDAELADAATRELTAAGLDLIGDAQDQPSWDEGRVLEIMRGCGAFAEVLPYRPQSQDTTSKYVLRECVLASGLELPSLVLADARVDVPEGLRRLANVRTVQDDGVRDAFSELARSLAEEWQQSQRGSYVFFATDFDSSRQDRRKSVKDLVEFVTTLPCVLGEYVRGSVVQQEIVDTVTGAALVLADITDESANVYVEIGAARAAGVPLALLRQGPSGRPTFMLRDRQVWDYQDDAGLLARVTRVVYPFRRQVFGP
jgi:hypothetical protein